MSVFLLFLPNKFTYLLHQDRGRGDGKRKEGTRRRCKKARSGEKMGERRQRNEVEGRGGMEKTQGEKLYENKMYIDTYMLGVNIVTKKHEP